jgi:threonine synthase
LDDDGVVDVIRSVYEDSAYLLDPHTAIGLEAARQTRRDQSTPMICLATAHPAKFPDAVTKAVPNGDPALPQHMADLFEREERYDVLDNDASTVHSYIAGKVRL